MADGFVRFPPKPREGSSCNGCGVCCAEEVCEIGAVMYPNAQPPCPGLRIAPERDRTYCEVVAAERAARMAPRIADALGIGHGCNAEDEVARG